MQVLQSASWRGERQILCKASSGENVIPASLNLQKGGKPNFLRTAQFTPLTWLPKSLFNQFKRIANVYFLFIAVVVVIGSTAVKFSPKDWRSKLGPFVFVLMWTALKDLYEDMRRRKDDQKENNQVVKKYNCEAKSFEDTFWSDVLVGDLLFIKCDEPFPADLVLLQSANNGTAFISTVMLDGETNLKERNMPKVFVDMAESAAAADGDQDHVQQCLAFAQKLLGLGTQVKLGPPSPVLADIRGQVILDKQETPFPLGEANFLPRGCMLKNTHYVFAVAAYVGGDTKTRLNAIEATLKFSAMQVALNMCIRLLLASILCITLYATIMSAANVFGDDDKEWPFYVMFFRFSIAFYHAVPMSLYVVYEMLKLALGYQVSTDEQMEYEGQGAVARTADLMEEMGQVDFIFSDKTGTLTANEMVFARAHVDGKDFGDFRHLESRETTKDPQGLMAAKSCLAGGDAHSEALRWYFTCLATCHEVVLDSTSSSASGLPSYTGMSPDEVALVSASRDVGIVFEQRSRLPDGTSELEIRDEKDNLTKYEVLMLLQFTSDRKRMSVIVQSEDKAWCITKGADSVMEGLVDGGFPEAAHADVLKFSKTGLRVLVVAARELDKAFLQSWLSDYAHARGILDESKDEKVNEVVARMEQGLRFVGLTAVEDRLQDGVPEAIETVKQAGSRVWVLTGDKTETAVNIAYSCALFTDSTKLAYCVSCRTPEEAREGLDRARRELAEAAAARADAGLVVDGGTLLQALPDPVCRRLIYELGVASRSCICSRLSPKQKLELVQLVRQADPKRITLAIGDGANDVPMILGGHVGIGIRGKEGAAAVQVCDVAISQFRFLVPLLLCHGRRSYRRVAVFFCYYLYKNVVLLMADLVWMHWDNFNGNIAFPEYLSIAFNAFFTSWHVLFVLGFDYDVPDNIACAHPELYKVGPEHRLFNPRVFAKWMGYAVLHGMVAWLVPFAMVGTEDWDSRQFWVSSCCAFTNVIHICLLKMIIVSENPFSKMTLLPSIGSWLMFVCYLWGLCYTGLGWSVQSNMKYVAEEMFKQGKALNSIILGPLLALSVDLAERLIMRYVFPSEVQQLEFKFKDTKISQSTVPLNRKAVDTE